MLGWFRRKKTDSKETFSLGYVNSAGLDLADYMSEEQARRFCNALVGCSDVAGYFERLLREYKLWASANGRIVYGLQGSLAEYDEEIDGDAALSAIIRWAAGRPPHVKMEHKA